MKQNSGCFMLTNEVRKWFFALYKITIISIQASRGTKKPNKLEKKVYPLRVQQRLNYMDVEVPDDDDFICKN